MLTQQKKIELRGPRHLMSQLTQLGIERDKPQVHYLWLDDENRVLAVSQAPVEVAEARHVILLVVDDASSTNWDGAQSLENLCADLGDFHVLDALHVRHNRWRSMLCNDTSCCPSEGNVIEDSDSKSRIMPQRRALFAAWQSWLLTGAVPSTCTQLAADSLKDLPLRDALLALMIEDNQTLKQWQGLQIESASSPALLSIKASAEYLAQQFQAASDLLNEALCLDPQYSLAKLLQQALDADAPSAIVIAAFSKYTPEELLQRATSDVNVTDVNDVKLLESMN